MRRRHLLGPIAATTLLAALVYRAVPPAAQPRLVAGVGDPAPALPIPRLSGKPWLLHAWASWCAPCREEHPLLMEAARAEAIAIVGLNPHDDPRSAAEWLLRHGDPYTARVDDPDGRLSAAWGLRGVPASVVVDAEARVRWRHEGALTPERWREALSAMKEKA